MKMLVTGAAGFIGFHLVKILLEKGHHVVGLDNINNYYDVNLKYARLSNCGIFKDKIEDNRDVYSVMDQKYVFRKTDITDLTELKRLFDEKQFDLVFHLAAQPGVRYSLENPQSYIQSNIIGFTNILECCRHNKIKHLIYASSSSVYGESDKVPFSETDKIDKPVSLYAATKKSNELMAYSYSHLYELPTTGLRFFTVYGPWGRPDMAPMLFAKAISANQPIKVFNNGEMSRDFTYVSDIVQGIVLASECIPNVAQTQNAPHQIFNIGNGAPVSLMEFIRILEQNFKIVAKKIMMPMQPGDVPRTWADITALSQIGYKSTTPLEIGIKEFVNWYKEIYIRNR